MKRAIRLRRVVNHEDPVLKRGPHGVKQVARLPTEPHGAVPDLLRPTTVLRFEENCLLEAHIAELKLKQTRCRY